MNLAQHELPQIHTLDLAQQEIDKYTEMWDFPDYSLKSPGGANVDRFLEVCNPKLGSRIVDVGCGQGVAGLELASRGYDVWYMDLVADQLHPDVNRKRFIQTALWEPWDRARQFDRRMDYGYCCDVMEHIPVEFTMLVVERMLRTCFTCYIVLSNLHDEFGKIIGQPLHLTVQPYAWWLNRLASICEVIDARDRCGHSLFVCRGW